MSELYDDGRIVVTGDLISDSLDLAIISEPTDLSRLTVADSISSAACISDFRKEYKFCFPDPDHPEVSIECTESELQSRVVRDMEAERLFVQWFPDNTSVYKRDTIKKIPRMIIEDTIGTLIVSYLIKWWGSGWESDCESAPEALDIYMDLAIKLYKDFKLSLDDISKKLAKAGLEDKEDPQRILDAFNKKMKSIIERG